MAPKKQATGKRKVTGGDAGRKASAPLYVMLEPDRLDRYKAVAEDMKVSMRDLVVLAVDEFISRRKAPISDFEQVITQNFPRSANTRVIGESGDVLVSVEPSPPDVSSVLRLVVSLSSRVGELENDVERLRFISEAHERRMDRYGIPKV